MVWGLDLGFRVGGHGTQGFGGSGFLEDLERRVLVSSMRGEIHKFGFRV